MRDFGIGISEADKRNLFKLNFKSTNETSQLMNKSGHGIGLHVCKLFAESLGGNLVYTDPEGEGAQFILSLELEKVAL